MFKVLFRLRRLFSIFTNRILSRKKTQKKVPKLIEARKYKGYIKTTSKKTLKILAFGERTLAGVGVDL